MIQTNPLSTPAPHTPLERAAADVQARLARKFEAERRHVASAHYAASPALPFILLGLQALIELLKYCYGDDVSAMRHAAAYPGVWGRFRAWRVMRRVMRENPPPPIEDVSAGQVAEAASETARAMRYADFAELVHSVRG